MNSVSRCVLCLLVFSVAQFGNAHAEQNKNKVITEPGDIARHYVFLAHTMFSDALLTARNLHSEINAFIATPNQETHLRTKQAWIDAHSVYSQTEVFRFGNPNVDAWEGSVNAWPMDEGMVDYVSNGYQYEQGNPHALENFIGSDIEISVDTLREMHEKAGSEANVATGYHAIEFLLWGQDLNESPDQAGQRAHTDYLQTDLCTHPPCDRRAKYLLTVSNLLQEDLANMVAQWHPEKGGYAKEYLSLPDKEQLRRILFGMGSLSQGELAGERIRVALLANAQEDEQSCFSDTTDVAIYNNALGIRNVYSGFYRASNDEEYNGPSLSDLVKMYDPDFHAYFEQQLALTMASAYEISSAAEEGEPFDQQIAANNKSANDRLQKMIERLRNQTLSIERISEILTAS